MNLAEHWVVLSHRSVDAMFVRLLWHKAHRDGADCEFERNLFGSAQRRMVPVEPACRAKCGVACEAEFFLHSEDADLYATLAFDLRLAREDERRLAQIGLAGQRLHLFGRESSSIG